MGSDAFDRGYAAGISDARDMPAIKDRHASVDVLEHELDELAKKNARLVAEAMGAVADTVILRAQRDGLVAALKAGPCTTPGDDMPRCLDMLNLADWDGPCIRCDTLKCVEDAG